MSLNHIIKRLKQLKSAQYLSTKAHRFISFSNCLYCSLYSWTCVGDKDNVLHQGDNTDGACVPVRTFRVICICTGLERLHTVPGTDFHKARMLVWHSATEYVFALNLFNRWPISQRSGMSTYSWPAQHYWAQTVFEKLWLCALFGLRLWIALRGAEELASHVSSKVLMGATLAIGL